MPNMTFYLDLNKAKNENISYQYSIIIPIYFNSCENGEIFSIKIFDCIKCEENYFTLNNLNCSLCPLNSYCPGGDIIEVYPNFWRSSNYSSNIYKCDEILFNCLGGFESKCNENYQGILCSNCKINYFKDFVGICEECPNMFVNIALNICLFAFLISFLHKLFLFFLMKKVSKEKKCIIRIFIDYIHLVYFTQIYDQNLLKSTLEIYTFHKSTRIFSVNCFLSIFLPEYNIYYVSISKICFFYLGIALYLILSFRKIREKLIKSLIMFFYFSFPFFFEFIVDKLICQSIDNKNVLKYDSTISCSDTYLNIFQYIFIIPNILIICFIFPVIYLGRKLFLKRRNIINSFGLILFIFAYPSKRKLFKKRYRIIPKEICIFLEKLMMILSNVTLYEIETKLFIKYMIILVFLIWTMDFYRNSQKIIKWIYLLMKLIFLMNVYFCIIKIYFYNEIIIGLFIMFSAFLKILFFLTCFLIYFKNSNRFKNNKIFLILLRFLRKISPIVKTQEIFYNQILKKENIEF